MGLVGGEAHWESVSGGMAVCDAKLVCVSGPLQPVRLDTGAPTASTRVTVTTEPSAAPTMGSAGAAPAGLDSTARSVSLSPLPDLSARWTHSGICWQASRTAAEIKRKYFPFFLSFFFFR